MFTFKGDPWPGSGELDSERLRWLGGLCGPSP